jgi:ribonuclease-3
MPVAVDYLEVVQEIMGVRFLDITLLRQALTHTSFRNEHVGVDVDNERLEFLGDAVIELAVSDYLWEMFPGAPEGDLTQHRSYLVREEAVASMARDLGLGAHIRLGHGEEKSGGREKDSVLADVFEAVVAAIHVDQDFAVASDVVRRCIADRASELEGPTSSIDYKGRLQEQVQAVRHRVPRYRVEEETGPDHEKSFEVSVTLHSGPSARGMGRSKKEAEQAAAAALIAKVEADPALIDLES